MLEMFEQEGETALIMAVSRNEFSLLKLLISRGADLNISTKVSVHTNEKNAYIEV